MPKGSCFCGKSKIEFEKLPDAKIICYCIDCKKVSGSSHGISILVPFSEFSATGPLKRIEITAESGRTITNNFCENCGTTLYREGPIVPDHAFIKTGVLDEVEFEDKSPVMEAYTYNRAAWMKAVDGAKQVERQPDMS